MRLNKYGRELDLILLLTGGGSYTAQQLADKLGITRRSLYYYLEYLRDSGFLFHKSGAYYRIDRQSPFFRQLRENIVLNEGEAAFVYQMLDGLDDKNLTAQTIKSKLEHYYNMGDISSPAVKRRRRRNVDTLKQAMAQRKMVVLRGYSSPHSHSVSDRIVEPFLIFNEELDVRCYEVKAQMNKTFKTSRMKSVEILDVPWVHEDLHKEIFTDIFGFSGEERIRVQLRLGQLAYNIMLEEHPDSELCITREDDSHWLLDIDVVSMLGIGRFVMGLYADIDVLGGDELKAYIDEQCSVVAGQPV
ncbi:MAG: WYL domain-containing protein [Prevotella sp.]|nr:WYL domain-containing protein [Prevotella sp.]